MYTQIYQNSMHVISYSDVILLGVDWFIQKGELCWVLMVCQFLLWFWSQNLANKTHGYFHFGGYNRLWGCISVLPFHLFLVFSTGNFSEYALFTLGGLGEQVEKGGIWAVSVWGGGAFSFSSFLPCCEVKLHPTKSDDNRWEGNGGSQSRKLDLCCLRRHHPNPLHIIIWGLPISQGVWAAVTQPWSLCPLPMFRYSNAILFWKNCPAMVLQ